MYYKQNIDGVIKNKIDFIDFFFLFSYLGVKNGNLLVIASKKCDFVKLKSCLN